MDYPQHATHPGSATPGPRPPESLEEIEQSTKVRLAGFPRLARRWRSIPTGLQRTDELVVGPQKRIVHLVTGDDPARWHDPVDLGPAGPDPTGVIADWLGRVAGQVVAAFALEPVDPDSQLDDQQRATWIPGYPNRLDGVSFHLDDQTVQALRARLREQEARYAEVAEALRNPLAAQSQQVFADLRSTAFGAAYGAHKRRLQQLERAADAPSAFVTCPATVERTTSRQRCGMTLDNHGTCPNASAHLP